MPIKFMDGLHPYAFERVFLRGAFACHVRWQASRFISSIHERGKLGLHLLQGVPTLFQVAQAHSDDMEKRGFLGDATPEGDAVADKARRAGYEGRSEVLTASGAEQPDGVLREWLGQCRRRPAHQPRQPASPRDPLPRRRPYRHPLEPATRNQIAQPRLSQADSRSTGGELCACAAEAGIIR